MGALEEDVEGEEGTINGGMRREGVDLLRVKSGGAGAGRVGDRTDRSFVELGGEGGLRAEVEGRGRGGEVNGTEGTEMEGSGGGGGLRLAGVRLTEGMGALVGECEHGL
jgi:hypothetical protein